MLIWFIITITIIIIIIIIIIVVFIIIIIIIVISLVIRYILFLELRLEFKIWNEGELFLSFIELNLLNPLDLKVANIQFPLTVTLLNHLLRSRE